MHRIMMQFERIAYPQQIQFILGSFQFGICRTYTQEEGSLMATTPFKKRPLL